VIYNTTFSARLTNQLTFGVNYFKQTFSDADSGSNPIALGLNTGVTNPVLSGTPNILIGTFDPIGPEPYSGRQDVTGHLDDALKATYSGFAGGASGIYNSELKDTFVSIIDRLLKENAVQSAQSSTAVTTVAAR
jgi:hypothetical protein